MQRSRQFPRGISPHKQEGKNRGSERRCAFPPASLQDMLNGGDLASRFSDPLPSIPFPHSALAVVVGCL